MARDIPQRPVDFILQAIVVADDSGSSMQLAPRHVGLLRHEIARLQALIPDYRRAVEITHSALSTMAAKHGEPPPPELPERDHDEIELLEALESAECVVRQVARDTYGEELTVKEYADRAGYDS